MSPLLISHHTVARELSRFHCSTFAAKHILLVIAILLSLHAPCASSAQPAPAVYTWSWNPADSLIRVEAQVFVDESNCSNICFQNFFGGPYFWPDVNCGFPNPIPNFWNWSILPPVPPPAPPVPRAVPPIDWDEQAPPPPNELGTIFIGDYCPCPTSDALGNGPIPPPDNAPGQPKGGLDWLQRVAFHAPIGIVSQNMFGHPSLQPEMQITNDVFASDGTMPWATVPCINAPQPPGLEVTGFAEQVVTARGRRGLIGGVQSFGTRTWEIRSTNYADMFANQPPGGDRYVGEGCATIVAQIPLLINGLTSGLPFRYTFEFQTLGETINNKEDHNYLDPLLNLFIRPDIDNAYSVAQIKMYDNGNWATNFIEYAGSPPGVPSPGPVSGNHNGATFLPVPIGSTYPVVLRFTSRVRTQVEDQPDFFTLQDSATASMNTNIFLTVFGPPVWGDFEDVPAGGDGPAYDFWMGKYEVSNVEYVDFLNDAEQDQFRPGGPTERSAFMVFDPTTGEVRTPNGDLMFTPMQSFVPGTPFNMIQKIRYRPFMAPGTRYVVDTGAEADAVIGVTWLGAVKYCNWLTLTAGYQTFDRCYTEGNTVLDWHPVTISNADWAVRDLNAFERANLVAQYRGFRLPMDNLGTAGGHIGNQVNAFNEWYKASAYDPAAPPSARIGPGGETVPPFHWMYGFGRDSISNVDANYITSGDRYDEGVASVGYFDGVNTLSNNTPTSDTGNPWGYYDLAGNVDEWSQDKGVSAGLVQRRITRTGSWTNIDTDLAASRRAIASVATASMNIGFRVLTTSQPPTATPPDNDMCADAGLDQLVPNTNYTFDSTFSTADGPAEPCGFTGIPNQDSDMWFTFVSPCSGTVTLTLWDSNGIRTQVLAAYNQCPQAGGTLQACDSNLFATISLNTVAGQILWIRTGSIGGVTGQQTIQTAFTSVCTADIAPAFGDCAVGVPDLLAIINAWGPCPGCPADIAPPGGDGTVGVPDLLAIINAWGPCP